MKPTDKPRRTMRRASLARQPRSALSHTVHDAAEDTPLAGVGADQEAGAARDSYAEPPYRQMFERNLAIKLLIDPATGAILDANPAAAEFYGYSLQELRSLNISQINTLNADEVGVALRRASSEHRNYFRFRHRLASGELRDVEVYSSPLDVDGRHLLFSIVHDITDRRRAEEETTRTLALLRATLESTADGVLVVASGGRLLTYNRKFAQMWRIPEEELAAWDGPQLWAHVMPQLKDPEAFLESVGGMNAHSGGQGTEVVEFKDGRVFECYAQPQHVGDEIEGKVWSFRDVTERVHAEEEIKRLNAALEQRVAERTERLQALNSALEQEIAERVRNEVAALRLAAIVESSGDVIIGKTLEGIITSWNAGAQRIYGYTAEEVVGRPVSVLIPEDHLDDLDFIMPTIRRGERVDQYETVRRHKDGHLLNMSVSVSPIINSDGVVMGASTIARDITEQTQLREKLLRHAEEIKAEHEKLATLVANVEVALMMFDAEGRVVLVNESWESRNKIPRDLIVGRRYDDLGNIPALTNAQALVDRVLATGEPSVFREMAYFPPEIDEVSGEVSLRGQEDAGIYVDGSLLPVRDETGAITGAMAVTIDVTDKVRARRDVEEQRALLQTIFETTPLGIVYYDRQMRVVDCNIAWARFANLTMAEVKGRSLYDLFPVTRTRKQFHRRALRGESFDQYSQPFPQADGEMHYYDIHYRPVRDASGGVIGILNTALNVTDNVRAAQQISRQRELLATIVESTPTGIASFDKDLRLVSLNSTWARLVGTDPGTAQGRNLYEIMPAALERHDLHAGVLKGESLFLANVEYVRPGELHPGYYDIYFRPLRSPSGGIDGMVVAVLDVTGRYALDREKDDFLALASHELKTPVTTIKGSAQVGKRVAEKLGNERLVRILTVIDEQSNRLTRLINELLDVTQLGAGSLAVHHEPLDLGALVGEVVSNLALAAPDFKLELDLPPAPIIVAGDHARLEQVVMNLVHNAIKYSGGSQRVEIEVSTAQHDDGSGLHEEAVVSVRDYGVGVPAEQQPHVFERFFRGRNVDARHYDGLGLGLFISHGIVERHAGRMWLQSVEGKGSTFYFALPGLVTGNE